MGKKLIYLLLAVFLGGFIVLQSCNESPIVQNETYINIKNQGHTIGYENIPNNGNTVERYFKGIGLTYPSSTGYPQLCPLFGTGPIELWAGVGNESAGNLVGYIEFFESSNTGKIWVRYNFVPPNPMQPYAVDEINFQICEKVEDFKKYPMPPPPGSLNYSLIFDPPLLDPYWDFEYTLPLDSNNDGNYAIVAHASLCLYGGLEGFNAGLPDGNVTYSVQHNSEGGSYFKITFLNGTGGFLGAGPYQSFCVDDDNEIYPPITSMTGKIYSAYESVQPEVLEGAIENWSNMDMVNYIINKYYQGSSVEQHTYTLGPDIEDGYPFEGTFSTNPVGTGTVTWQDIQAAIWALLEKNEPLSNSWGYLQPQSALTYNNVWGMVWDALQNGDGFIPGCNQKVMAILVPNEGNIQIITAQPTIINLQLPCYTECNTAYGDGKYGANFPQTGSWATYFIWNKTTCPTSR